MTNRFAIPDSAFVSDFAVDCLIGPVGAQTPVKGLYDAPTTQQNTQALADVNHHGHQLQCRDVDLPAVVTGMRVEIPLRPDGGMTVFTIQSPKPTGNGMTVLELTQSSPTPRVRPY